MSKKILILALVVCENCLTMQEHSTMSMEGEFLQFVSNKAMTNVSAVKKNIEANIGNSRLGTLPQEFISTFGGCFDGFQVSPHSSRSSTSAPLATAAHIIGLAYLREGETKRDLQLLNKASAFFRSVPKVTSRVAGSDECRINLIETVDAEIRAITRREDLFRKLGHS